MALDNIRERLALHFDAEASLDSRVTRDGYEVHIRMPYRTTKPATAANGRAGSQRREPHLGNGAQKRRELRANRTLPGVPALKVVRG